ncbi:hypothetical protein K457DRAFT_130751 [Linnemannia elongata AG-77]|uniref:Uncharacterized protein n=1 Tax=Linnemannia elongata AG-77 TaxID=1314771 RepID=A0A197JF68_9FUNG|nr:hypothetical protein K457DRAFT_130751 [Linnemannia elongata AG-77]
MEFVPHQALSAFLLYPFVSKTKSFTIPTPHHPRKTIFFFDYSQKSCRQACILFIFAVATTEAADGRVLFLHDDRRAYHVSAGLNCTNFPGWINDQSFQYSIDKYYNCVVFDHAGCSGQSATIGPTNDWTNVPIPGISAIICWN